MRAWAAQPGSDTDEKLAQDTEEAAEEVFTYIKDITKSLELPSKSDKAMTLTNVPDTWWLDHRDKLRRTQEPSERLRQEPETEFLGVRAYSVDLGERIISHEATARRI